MTDDHLTEYTVTWETVVDAVSPRQAAEHCWAMYFQRGHTASVFEVHPKADRLRARINVVDIGEEEPDRVEHHFSPEMLHRMARLLVADGGDLEAVMDMLEKPHHWPELMTRVILDEAYDGVATEPDAPDLLSED